MTKHTYTKDQSGMSSILFAMVFMMILLLLAVGFAKLVRNDQTDVVDKTLSYQAQYAAETAINRTAEYLRSTTPTPAPQANCSQNLDISFAGSSSASAKVTCITWSTQAATIEKSVLSAAPFVTKMHAVGAAMNSLQISWEEQSSTQRGLYNGTGMPTLNAVSSMAVIRVTVGGDNDDAKNFYLVPTVGAGSPGAFGNFLGQSGQRVNAYCTGTPVRCTAGINNFNINSGAVNNFMAIAAYGSEAHDVVISGYTALNAGGAAGTFDGAQAEIDANAVANEVTRRIRARVPLAQQTWSPGFAVSADTICKDYKVDGSQSSPVTGVAACPFDPAPAGAGFVPVGNLPSPPPQVCTAPQKDITLVMDASSSMVNANYGGLGALRAIVQRQAAQNFINALNLDPTENMLSIVQFNSDAIVSQPLSTNAATLISATGAAPHAAQTHYNPALLESRSLLTGAGSRAAAPKYIVFMSDGRPNDLGENTLAEQAATANLITNTVNSLGPNLSIYAIAVDYNPNGTDVLPNMARGTGWYSNAPTEQALTDRLLDIANELNCN